MDIHCESWIHLPNCTLNGDEHIHGTPVAAIQNLDQKPWWNVSQKKNDILMLGKWDHTHKHEDFTKKIDILNYWTMCVLSNCRVGFSNHHYKIRKQNIIDI